MGSSGGGGSSGKVRHRANLEDLQDAWLGNSSDIVLNMADEIEAVGDNSPYNHAILYDPSDDIEQALMLFETYWDKAEQLDALNDWDASVQRAIASADDADLLSSDQLDDAVDAFDTRQRGSIADAYNRFSGGMALNNAAMSSAFVLGLAKIENRQAEVKAEYEANLGLKFREIRSNFILQAAAHILQFTLADVEAAKNAAYLGGEIRRFTILAHQEFHKEDLALDVRDASWNIGLFQYPGNLIASIGGGVLIPDADKKSTSAASVIGGAIGGAAMGSAAGPVGTAVGGLLGVLGAL